MSELTFLPNLLDQTFDLLQSGWLGILCISVLGLLIDPKGESVALLKPDVVVDAIIAKKNLGTTIDMACLLYTSTQWRLCSTMR